VWAFFVVLHPPLFDLLLRIPNVQEPIRIQTFITESAVEALHVSVLHGRAGLDVHQPNASLFAPTGDVPAREFRPVVASQGLRRAPLSDHALQYV
jgi:hypothetical protein